LRSRPARRLANVRVNDPLAVGIEELKQILVTAPRRASILRPPRPKARGNRQTTLSGAKRPKTNWIPFTFPAQDACRVSLVGDFNNWNTKAMPMHKGADGVWYLRVPLKPGRHEYRYFADDVWRNDPGAQQTPTNAMGTRNCVLLVTG
jgi:hypothetical protein